MVTGTDVLRLRAGRSCAMVIDHLLRHGEVLVQGGAVPVRLQMGLQRKELIANIRTSSRNAQRSGNFSRSVRG